jgi:hypothetical protein
MGVFPLLLIVVVLALVVFTIYLISGGANRMMDRMRDEVGPRFLEETIPTLLTWEPQRALPDVSSLCKRRGQSSGLGGGRSYARGTVQSLENRGSAWLAFTVDTQQREGVVKMHTSANAMEVHIRRDSAHWAGRQALITIDGRPLGSFSLKSSELYGVDGQPLGRLSGGAKLIMQGMTDYRTLEIDGDPVADINYEPLSPLERLGPMPAAFVIYKKELSEQEEWWLVALFAIALYSDSLSGEV